MDSFSIEVDRPKDQPHGLFYYTSYDRGPDPGYANLRYTTGVTIAKKVPLSAGPLPPNMKEATASFSKADAAIDHLKHILPIYPRLLTPAANTPLLHTSRTAWEHEGVPFEAYELGRGQQYMTLLNSPPNRGISFTEGGWEEHDFSPASNTDLRSRTATPDPNKPRTKISLSDYKKAPKKTAEELEKVKEVQAVKKKEEHERIDNNKKVRDTELKALAQVQADRREEPRLKEEQERAKKRKEAERERERRAQAAERAEMEDALERKEALRLLKEAHQAKVAKEARQAPKIAAESTNKNSKKLPPMLSPLPAELGADDHVLPRLLSPDLPAEVEEALARIRDPVGDSKVKHSEHAMKDVKTIDGRRERSRLPDAPGVARKKPKTKNADHGIASDGPSKLVKMKYGKHNSKYVERLLRLKPQPGQTFTETIKPRVESKRPREKADNDEHEEPLKKKAKAPSHLEAARPQTPKTTAAKTSAVPTPSSHRALLGTPKKGEAMIRVSSTESHGHARTPSGSTSTPKPIPTSTPVSMEKPRMNPLPAKPMDIDGLRTEFTRYQEMGTALKRKMDQVLKTKEKGPQTVTLEQQKLGAAIGIESAAAYMLGFNAHDKTRKMERKLMVAENWEQLLALLPFIMTRCKQFPTLSVAANLACAVSREVLSGIHLERLAVETGKEPLDPRFKEAVVNNGRQRPAAWNQYLTEAAASGMPGNFFTGASIAEAVGVMVQAIEGFAAKEGLTYTKKVEI